MMQLLFEAWKNVFGLLYSIFFNAIVHSLTPNP